MTGIFTRNLGWKLVSVAAAVVLWISVSSEPELATLHAVPVEYKGVPDDLEISSRFVEDVTIEVRGPSGRLRDMRDSRSAVILDFSSVHQPGERTFNIESGNLSLPRGIQLVRTIPDQLRFVFERRIVRDVPVEVHLSAPHEGYSVVHYEVNPPKLTVAGPESSVERIKAVETDPLDVSNVFASKQFRVNTFLPERLSRFQSASQVTVEVVVKKK